MKYEIIVDDSVEETTVRIVTKSIDENILAIQKYLERGFQTYVPCYGEGQVFLVSPDDVIRFYTEQKKIYALTSTGKKTVRLALYEWESRLQGHNFLRVSQGDLVNLSYVKRLDLSHTGTIVLEMKMGEPVYAARRYVKSIKRALGI